MARRFVPVLLAARMDYRVRELQLALATGDFVKAQKETHALRLQWVQFAHIARERSEILHDEIHRHVEAVTEAPAAKPDDLSHHLLHLDTLLKELAA